MVPTMKKLCILMAALLLLTACQSADLPATQPPETQPTVQETVPATQAPTDAPTQPAPSFVEVWREGEASQIPVEIVSGTVGDYTIAMDPEYFTFSAHETVDMFAYESWPGEQAVYYAVSRYENGYDPAQFVSDILYQFEASYESWYSEELTIGQYDATLVCLERRKDAPDYYRHVFLIDGGDTCYIIETEFYVEMYEGLYAIMRALFDTFTTG